MNHSPVHPCRTLVYISPIHKDRVSANVSVSLKHYGSRHSSKIPGCPLCLSRFEALWPPSSGEASSSIMRGVFIAGVVAAFAITVVGERDPHGPLCDTAFFSTPAEHSCSWHPVVPSTWPVVSRETQVSPLPSERPLCGWSGLDFPLGER